MIVDTLRSGAVTVRIHDDCCSSAVGAEPILSELVSRHYLRLRTADADHDALPPQAGG